ncbi:hypothetical protein BV898_14835 [Hypsibius exemplaris]|uniref:Uncharacterized protein n=1 Tax=Hypsibius exemplaris TaxID=2072580 RepID=A0A9X6RJW8_HYPEX|nr:hypothetical protein BV898_14835 [Hypsibius exemplaris]
MDLRDACRQFIKNGISDLTAVENLKDSFSAAAQLPVEHDDVIKSKLRTAVMNVILTCKNSVTGLSVDEENGLEAYRELCGLVLTGVEYLRAGELLTATGKLEQIHLTMAQLLYYFIKSSITQNFVADLLPVIVLLQDFIRDCISTPGFTGTANVSIESDLLNICATTYPFLLNWGIKALSKADHIQYMEVMDVLLAAIPFKTFAVQFTPPDPGALTWTVRLCAVIKMVKKADRADVPYAVLYQSVMTTLRRCRNVSVEDLLMVNEELVVILTASSDRELQGDKLTQTLTKGLEFIDADGKFRPLREQIVAVMKAQWLFSGAHETIRTATAAAQAIGKKNEAVRQLTKQKAKSSSASRPSRLNFDDHGDVKQEDFQSMQMLSDAVSLSDEKSLMLPMVHILEALELAFSNWPDPAGDVNRLRVGEEAATFLLELSHFFHFHRLHYLALSAAQLSWKLVCGFSGDKSLVLEAASAFMLTLRVFHLYDRRSVLVYEKSKNLAADCQEDHPLVYGLWLAEAGWVLLLSSQRRKGEGRHPCTEPGGSRSCVLRKCWRLQSDAAFSALLSLKSIWEKLDAKAEDEHKFAVPFLKAHYFRLAAGMTQVEPQRFREWMEMPSIMSQLSMLESGKTESSLCLSCVRQSSLSQLFAAKDLFLQVLLDIGQFLIRIGAPVEAFPHFMKGQRFANSELSCRWNMVFLAGLIQCRQNLGRTSEASASLHELNGLLSNQNASILSALTKPGPKTKSARDSRVVDIDCLAAVTEQMALTIRRGAGEEPGSAPDSDPFNAYCSDRIAQLPLLKHSKKCSCSECVDYDLHASFLESIYLAMLDSKRRAELFNEGKEHYETLKLKYIAVASLLKNSGLADGEKTDDAVPAIIALGITKLRLRNAAITFPVSSTSDPNQNN